MKFYRLLCLFFVLIFISGCTKLTKNNNTTDEAEEKTTVESTNKLNNIVSFEEINQKIPVQLIYNQNGLVFFTPNDSEDGFSIYKIIGNQVVVAKQIVSYDYTAYSLETGMAIIDKSCKKMYILDLNLNLISEISLESILRGSVFNRSENIAVSSDGHKMAFFVNETMEDTVYIMDIQSSSIIEITKIHRGDSVKKNQLVGISKMKFLNDNYIFFEGYSYLSDSFDSEQTTDIGYIDINSGEITVIKHYQDIICESNESLIYLYDNQTSTNFNFTGQVHLLDFSHKGINTFNTINNLESENCFVSGDGKYLCTGYKSNNKYHLNIYDIKSNTLLKSFEESMPTDTFAFSKFNVCIDYNQLILYVSWNNDTYENISKYYF